MREMPRMGHVGYVYWSVSPASPSEKDPIPSSLIALSASASAACSEANTSSHTVEVPSSATISSDHSAVSSRRYTQTSTLTPSSSTTREKGESIILGSAIREILNKLWAEVWRGGRHERLHADS